MNECSFNIKLDMEKIKCIQSHEHTDWIEVRGIEINIVEEELMKIIERDYSRVSKHNNNNNNNISLKQVSRREVFTKN